MLKSLLSEEQWVILELKVLADVGLRFSKWVSALLQISTAKPELLIIHLPR